MTKRLIISALLVISLTSGMLEAQVEHVPLTSPVYDYLLRAENKGYLEHKSLSSLPLQRKEITAILNQMYNDKNLSDSDKEIVTFYLKEFNALPERNTVVFENEQNTDNIFFSDLISNKDKYIYKYTDSNSNVELKPLIKAESFFSNYQYYDESKSVLLHGGVRLMGTLSNSFGYYLQATNGSIISGDRKLAIDREQSYRNNVKFAFLESDLDFTQSHIRYDNSWFYATLGREVRNLGAGLFQKVFISNSSQPFDALSLGAKFSSFEYRFTHGSLLSSPQDSNISQGFNSVIPDKFLVMHRFAFRPSWGEFALWESVIYSDRSIDFAYLNPISFFKSLEHALRDRDNSMMGIDATIRPLKNLQLKGSFLLDDIIISEIGNGYWSNKTAWNIAATYSLDLPIDVGIEYSRVEPYTYSHFNGLNSYTNDKGLLGSIIKPNSDYIGFMINYWISNKYPISFRYINTRHGENVFENNELVGNVGGDENQSRRPDDKLTGIEFLDGNLIKTSIFELSVGLELIRNLNLKAMYSYETKVESNNYFRVILTLEDF
ncbi:MAG: hypothetical protein WC121_06635 [Candidatus Kapaibacterium sp.]